MLWNASVIKGYKIAGTDGFLGTASDFLFNDTSWKMRWLVVDLGYGSSSREALIPISALGSPDPVMRQLPVRLTMRQARDCPDVALDLPVSRQTERVLYAYYGWEPYLAGSCFGGAIAADFIPQRYGSEARLLG